MLHEPTSHELKCEHLNFQAIIDRKKTFEIRKNDRRFHVGDTLVLSEFKHNPDTPSNFTGRKCHVKITFIQPPKTAPGVDAGYRILAIGLVHWWRGR